jgi:hypothetical protein
VRTTIVPAGPVRGPAARAATMAAAGGLLAAGTLVATPGIRAAIVLPVAMLAPGYAIATLVMGRRGLGDPALMLALSALLSLSWYCLLGVLLYAIGVPFRGISVVAGADLPVVVAVVTESLRARAWPPATRWFDVGVAGPATSRRRGTAGAGTALGVGVVAGAALVATALHWLGSPAETPYSRLALAGRWANLQSAVAVQPRTTLDVPVSVANHGTTPRTYHLVPGLATGQRWAVRRLRVAPGRTWTGALRGTVPRAACLNRLRIRLAGRDRRDLAAAVDVWLRTTRGARETCRRAARRG